MADNVAITAGSGTTIAADDVGAGVLVQRVKSTWGPDGTANDTDVATGKPMPVQLRSPTGTDMAGTAGAASAAVLTVQGIASGTPQPVSGSLTTVTTVTTVGAVTAITNALPAGTNAIGKLAANSGVDIGDVDVASIAAGANRIGTVGIHDGTNAVTVTQGAPTTNDYALVVAMHPDGVNANGQAAMAASAPVVLASDQSTIPASPQPLATGGFAAPFISLDLDETEELVKTGAGCLYKLRITNRTTSIRYVKLYDGVLAGVTVGTTTPIDTIPVPAGGSADLATVITENFGGLGLPFTTGLCLAATTGFANNDTGAPGANDVIVSAYFK